ncbi:MAG: hypothetical protein GY868_01030 [Deltaproteobacteria bacterium]|nr:hypothetical protein [Deltaproteobacteria bacterium]
MSPKAAALVKIFSISPVPIIGTMLWLVGLELVMFVKDVEKKKDYFPPCSHRCDRTSH